MLESMVDSSCFCRSEKRPHLAGEICQEDSISDQGQVSKANVGVLARVAKVVMVSEVRSRLDACVQR